MRIITLNVNGIRAAARKGFFTWLARQRADIVCLQEIKAQHKDVAPSIFHPSYLNTHYFPAERPGYSGVALFSKNKPLHVREGFAAHGQHTDAWKAFDQEGRYIEAEFDQVCVASLYLPSGSAGEHRQAFKFKSMSLLEPLLETFRKRRKPYILCGDWNIAHTNKDIKNWRANQKNSGFLPEERAWLDQLFSKHWVDAFREVNPHPDQYTWWSNRGRAWDNNVGWRIDYQVTSASLGSKVQRARIYKDQRFSDHAPLIMDYDLS